MSFFCTNNTSIPQPCFSVVMQEMTACLSSLIHKKIQQQTILCLLLTFLSACSSLQHNSLPPSDPIKYDWPVIEQKLRQLTHWSLLGKLGVRTEEESLTVAINKWQQTDDQFEIDLSSTFFGLGSSRLFGSSDFLSIFQPGEDTLSSFEPDQLIASALGIPLPISHLALWIKALPADDLAFEQTLNAQGLPETLIQDNWIMTYSNYHTDYNPPLPGKIKLQHHNIRIILAIKAWTLP
jgi:outer membrane lipoprotein LolB